MVTCGSSSNTARAFIIFGKSQAIDFATARAHRASWGYQRKTKRLPCPPNAWPGRVDLPQYPTNFPPKCNIRAPHPAITSMLMSVEECPVPSRGRGSEAVLQSRWQITRNGDAHSMAGRHSSGAASSGRQQSVTSMTTKGGAEGRVSLLLINLIITALLLACASAIAKPLPPKDGCRPLKSSTTLPGASIC